MTPLSSVEKDTSSKKKATQTEGRYGLVVSQSFSPLQATALKDNYRG